MRKQFLAVMLSAILIFQTVPVSAQALSDDAVNQACETETGTSVQVSDETAVNEQETVSVNSDAASSECADDEISQDAAAEVISDDQAVSEDALLSDDQAQPEKTAGIKNGKCGENLTWNYSDSDDSMVITGSGPMYLTPPDNYQTWQKYWQDNGIAKIKKVVFDNGVTMISAGAFQGFSGLTKIVLPDTLTTINADAFEGCGLSDVVIPVSLKTLSCDSYGIAPFGKSIRSVSFNKEATEIPANVMRGAASIESVTIPDKVKKIGAYAFSGCGMSYIDLPDSLTSIGDHAFSECKCLQEVDIPDSVEEMGCGAFSSCSELTAAYLPAQLTELKADMFKESAVLNTIRWPKNIEKIDMDAFHGCNLINLRIPSTLKEVELDSKYESPFAEQCSVGLNVTFALGTTKVADNLFAGCNLLRVTIPGTVVEIGKRAFYYIKGLDNIASNRTVILPINVVTIDDEAFVQGGGGALQKVVIPDTAVNFGKDVFDKYASVKDSNITIYGILNSEAQNQADKYYINFVQVRYYADDYPWVSTAENVTKHELTVIVKDQTYVPGCDRYTPQVTVKDGKRVLDDASYTVAYRNNFGVGQATVAVYGKGYYAASSAAGSFNIKQASIRTAQITGMSDASNNMYTVSQPNLKVLMKTASGNLITLKEGDDYSWNVNGRKLYITGNGNYEDTVRKSIRLYGITPISSFSINLEDQNGTNTDGILHVDYTGSKIQPTVTLHDENGDEISASSYRVRYRNNINPGVGQVIITALRNSGYCGSATAGFVINPKDASGASVTLLKTEYPFTGKAQKPKPVVEINGKKVSSRYLKYVYSKNVNAGDAIVSVYGTGIYCGLIGSANFKITKIPFKKVQIIGSRSVTNLNQAARVGLKLRYRNTYLLPEDDYKVEIYNTLSADGSADDNTLAKAKRYRVVFTLYDDSENFTADANANKRTVYVTKR